MQAGSAGGRWTAAAGPGRPGALLAARLRAMPAAPAGLMPWAPVALAFGIGPWFLLHEEPGLTAALLCGAALMAALVLARLAEPAARLPAAVLALVAAGMLLMLLRAFTVSAPVLPWRYYGPVEGRVIAIDRSFSDALRVTLDQVAMPELTDAPPPERVRIALRGKDPGATPLPGQRLRLTAHVAPPDGPVEPGSFDFQRLAWFARLGGVGYTQAPAVELAAPDRHDWRLLAARMRMAISRRMQEGMGGGQAAALAAAFMTGDRSGIDAATNESMRASNLSHLISISGLHMGLITGFVFAMVRGGLALVPPLALRVDGRKIAALVAALAASFYLVLAGPDVATRRAYIMALVMMLAVLADRRAISTRSVALSALIVLGLEPESLVEPGFQMSFAATLALVVGFDGWGRLAPRLPAPLRPVAMAVLASLIAGGATAPIAAAHFNRIAEYGLLANLLATPLMALVVMPAGCLALLLLPLGLAGPFLWLLRWGTGGVLAVSDWVAGLDGAVVAVAAPPAPVLPLIGLGGLCVLVGAGMLWRGSGALMIACAFGLWLGTARPEMLISSDGALVGVMTETGRALSKPRGAGFVADAWLENDGDGATQIEAAARPAFTGPKGVRQARLAGVTVIALGAKEAAAVPGLCRDGAILVLAARWDGPAPQGCRFYDQRRLRRTGAIAISGGKITTARDLSGWRYWNSRRAREAVLGPTDGR